MFWWLKSRGAGRTIFGRSQLVGNVLHGKSPRLRSFTLRPLPLRLMPQTPAAFTTANTNTSPLETPVAFTGTPNESVFVLQRKKGAWTEPMIVLLGPPQIAVPHPHMKGFSFIGLRHEDSLQVSALTGCPLASQRRPWRRVCPSSRCAPHARRLARSSVTR